MITVFDLIEFMNNCCVRSSANLKFGIFAEAFRRWLPPDRQLFVDRENIFLLFSQQNKFKTNQEDLSKCKRFKGISIIGMAIPGKQREMVSS